MQNLDVLFMLALFIVATYYGIIKPTVESSKFQSEKDERNSNRKN